MSAAKTTLRQRLREATSEAMLDAAEERMIECGYDKATMQEIAQAAGCATGTFYLYFKNKDVLLQAILARHSRAMLGRARQAIEDPGTPMEKVRAGLTRIVQYVLDHKPFFRLFFTVVPLRHRAMQQYLGQAAQREHNDYAHLELELLRQAQREGAIRNDMAVELLQIFVVEGGFAISEHFIFSSEAHSADEVMGILWGLMIGGLGGPAESARSES